MTPTAARALLPPVTFYQATLYDGPSLLLRIDREGYPAERWTELIEYWRRRPEPTPLRRERPISRETLLDEAAWVFLLNGYLSDVAKAIRDWRGTDARGIGLYLRKHHVPFSHLCRALTDCRPFGSCLLERAGIMRLTPLAIEAADEWAAGPTA